MLVLSRKIGETIRIGAELDLVVLEVARGRVKLGFAGSRSVPVRRGELPDSDAAATEAHASPALLRFRRAPAAVGAGT